MSSTLPTGLQLPEDGGDSNIWDNKLNTDLTLLDTMLRQIVALENEQSPVGTVRQIPDAAPLPTGWKEATGSGPGAALIGSGNGIAEGDSGGTLEWDDPDPLTGAGGGHQHTGSGDHQHAAAGVHTHGTYVGNSGEVELARSHLPAEPLQVSLNNILYNKGTGGGYAPLSAGTFVAANAGTYTENLGSGAGHAHSIAHTHANGGSHSHAPTGNHQHDTIADHQHTQYGRKWACAGRWIVKDRLLTLADLKSMTPVN